MLLAPIPTLNCLELVREFKYHLVECHWLQKYEVYNKFFEELAATNEYHLILDNSEGIGHRVTDEVLLDFAKKLSVKEVVVPDVNPIKSNDIKGAIKTLEMAKVFIEKTKDRDFQLMGVAHGMNIEEVGVLLRFYEKNEMVVGFPNKAAIPREFLLRYCRVPKSKRHLLGASSVIELERCKNLARSVDTNLPFRAATCNTHIFTYTDSCAAPLDIEKSVVIPDRASAYLRYVRDYISV